MAGFAEEALEKALNELEAERGSPFLSEESIVYAVDDLLFSAFFNFITVDR